MAQPIDNIDLPFEDRLRIYKVNLQAAKTELMRLKATYYQEYATGATTERLNQIWTWAGLVRGAAGIPNDDPTYGNNVYVTEQVQGALLSLENRPTSGGGTTTGLQAVRGSADTVVTLGVGVLALLFVGSIFSRK